MYIMDIDSKDRLYSIYTHPEVIKRVIMEVRKRIRKIYTERGSEYVPNYMLTNKECYVAITEYYQRNMLYRTSSAKSIIEYNINEFVKEYTTLVYNNIQGQQHYRDSLFRTPVPLEYPMHCTKKGTNPADGTRPKTMFNII